MSKKKKLDGAAVQEFLMQHGEKIGLGVVGIIALLFVFSAIGQPMLEESKGKSHLQIAANSATNHIGQFTYVPWEPPKVNIEQPELPAAAFEFDRKFDIPDVPKRVKRTKPNIFPVESLEVHAGRGAFATMESRRKQRRGYRYVAVNGLVPILKQAASYRAIFEDADRPPSASSDGRRSGGQRRDGELAPEDDINQPRYYTFVVQRAEVQPGNTDLQWKPYYTMDKYMPWFAGHFATGTTDIVPAEYIRRPLTSVVEKFDGRLPPILKRTWKIEEVCHSKIVEKIAPADSRTDMEEPPEDDLPGKGKKSIPFPLPGPGDPDSPFSGFSPDPKQKDMQFQPKDGPGIDQGTDSETDPDAAEPEAPAVEQDYVLFRFFDMFVEPGKTYAYRVQLVLYNPNHGLAPRYLADPKLSAEQFLLTEWSQPSPPVEVPYDVSVLAEKVSPPTVRSGGKDRFRTEPGGRVGAVVWDNANAIEVVQDVPVSRGTWANHRSTIETVDPLDGKPLKLEDYELKTDHLVVDLRSDALPSLLGGKWREDRDLTSPGEMLLLNDRGELIVRSEVEGAAAVARRQEKSAPKDPGEFGDPAFPAPGRDPFGQPPPEERGDTVDRFSPFGGGPSKDEKGPRRRR